ncbi:MAG: hypothetical protein ACR2MN_09540 [Acidimicrobiales bacterium]
MAASRPHPTSSTASCGSPGLRASPLVEYGAINESTLAVTSAFAYTSCTSDDWNPSIAVSDAGSGNQYVFVNWAYTDPGTGSTCPPGSPASALAIRSRTPSGSGERRRLLH